MTGREGDGAVDVRGPAEQARGRAIGTLARPVSSQAPQLRIRLGTRGSALAMAQSGTVAERLRARTGRPVELVEVTTSGDRSAAPVQRLGVGVFVSALRDALAAGEIDVAVHSYKDLPTAPAEGLTIAAVPPRADPRDVLVGRGDRTLRQLPAGARIGTGAPRRIAQLSALHAGLVCVPIRGNVDSRLARLTLGELDAVVLAAAGLQRLGRLAEVTEFLDPDLVLPAPAQGALAVECRTTDADLITALRELDDPDSRAAVHAERALLATLQAGCSAPVGGYATVGDGTIFLRGVVAAVDGSVSIRRSGTGTLADAESVGRRLAAELLDAGAESVLESAHDPRA